MSSLFISTVASAIPRRSVPRTSFVDSVNVTGRVLGTK